MVGSGIEGADHKVDKYMRIVEQRTRDSESYREWWRGDREQMHIA